VTTPTLPQGVRRLFRLARRRPSIDEEVADEVAFHLEMRAAELVERGLPPDAARAEARRRFGDTHQWSEAMSREDRERAAQHARVEWLGDLGQDLRYGVRSLRRAPLFSLLAVVTLALGIGANAAVFGVLKSVLLDALPYGDAGRLVAVYTRLPDGSIARAPLSAGMVTAVAERSRTFARVAAFESQSRDAILQGETGPVVVKVDWAEPALFPTLGVNVSRGRPLRDEDAQADTAFNVLVTHAAWQRLFGGDARILERSVLVNGIPRHVVGVLPAGFVGPMTDSDADFYLPMRMGPYMRTPIDAHRRQNHYVVARLKPGVTVEAAGRDLAAVSAGLARELPQFYEKLALWDTPLRDDMVGETRTPLLVLMASAGLVLLITCANLAGALLSRTISRRKEFAVRVAMGAGRGRLVRQLLTESLVLSLAGGAAGLALATSGLALLRKAAPHVLPAFANLSLDPGAVAVTAIVAVATGLAFGVVPALSAGRANVQGTLRDETRGTSEGRRTRTLRGLLVAGQIALCVSLLTGAGLLARTLWAITQMPLGLDPERVLAVSVQLPRAGYDGREARYGFIERYTERLRTLPGVTAVAASGQVPTGISGRTGLFVDGVRPPGEQTVFLLSEASDDYFRTLHVPLRDGRAFGPEDRAGGTISIIVSEGIAKQYWPNGHAVGATARLGPEADAPRATVVGVVGDVRNNPAKPKPDPILYMSVRQMPWNGPVFLMRTRGDPMALLKPAQQALAELDPRLPLHDPITLEAKLDDSLSGKRLPVVLITAFGALALLLASVGVYAMFANMTAAREKEFGVRVALGSSRGRIARLVLRQGGAWMALGLAGGALGVVAVSRAVRELLYGVRPFDPITLVVSVVVLLACGAVALLVPVRRATRVDPISALR
jgi:predicted permease